MTNNWQRVIVATATITLNLTTISANLVQAFAFKIEESEVDLNVLGGLASNGENTTEDIKANTCQPLPKLADDSSFRTVPVPNPNIKIKLTGSTVLREGSFEERILYIDKNEETKDIKSVQDEIRKIIQYLTDDLTDIENLTKKKLKQRAEDITDEISKLYLYSGYITSQAQLIYANIINDKIVEIQIHLTEGYLKEIIVKKVNNKDDKQDQNKRKVRNRVSTPSYICPRILQGVDAPINITKLEERLQLLSNNPLFENVEAQLEGVGENSKSKLVVKVEEANPFTIGLSADNYSPPSIGSERLGVNLRYLNPLRIGDQIAGSYLRSTTGGYELFDFTYQIPLNAKNGTLQFRAAPNRNEVTQSPFDELDIEGEKEVYEFTYRQPIVRELREEFALSLGFSFQEGQTFLNDRSIRFGIGPDDDGFSRTSTIQFAQDYTKIDSSGIWSLRSQFNFGTGLFDATTNDPPTPDGHFFSWFAQLQRGQRLSQDHLLVIQADLQLTPNSLLPAQQFVMGGGQSVRGYRQNVRSGDNGFRFSIEDRITALRNKKGEPAIQIAPFIDLGVVWNEPDNPNEFSDEQFLLGMGLGFQWKDLAGIDGLNLRLDYGIPLVELDDRGNNIQDDGLYFQVNYQP